MAASGGRRRRSNTRRRRLDAFSLGIIGIVVVSMIIGALTGPHGTKPSSAQSGITPTPARASAMATASTSPATVSHSPASTEQFSHVAAPASPRQASPWLATSRPSTPTTHRLLPKRTTSPSTAAAAPAGCYPKTNSGNCYEPGEYCRNSNHGMSGVAGDGENIKCEEHKHNRWRWEPM